MRRIAAECIFAGVPVLTAGSLILQPRDCSGPIDPGQLVGTLRELGVIGAAWPPRRHAYLVGERFLELITFMGCSPHIELAPPAGGGDFCHVIVHEYPAPRLLTGTNTRPPRCPACRKVTALRPADLAGAPAGQVLACNHCAATLRLSELLWRRDGGFGRVFVEVLSVFPGEAVPLDSLLQRLADATRCAWDYFYLTAPGGSGGEIHALG